MRGLSDTAVDRLRRAAGWPRPEGGRYRVLEAVARGGMGTVYRARDRELDREVALKVITGAGAADLEARMLTEAKILARLEHPGIVPVHDVGRLSDGRLYYAMRLVRGRPLDARAAREEPLPERLRILLRICEAVAYAHAHGVIHRDLKPENVMLGPFGEVLVMDWGVAKVLAGETPATVAATGEAPAPGPAGGTAHGTVLGTPGYMAPEQARGEVDRVDERTDVYALGALLAFLLTGEAPSPGVAVAAVALPGVPRPLAAVCRRALAARPEDRYGGVGALARDVTLYLAGQAVGAYREGLAERAWRFARRHRTALLLVLAYLLMRAALFLVARV